VGDPRNLVESEAAKSHARGTVMNHRGEKQRGPRQGWPGEAR